MWHSLLLLHVCGAVVGLLSGFAAMLVRKGSNWHGATGTVFFGSMLIMSSTAAVDAKDELRRDERSESPDCDRPERASKSKPVT